MRLLFALLVLLHGAAHAVGFLGAWGLAPRGADGTRPPSLNAVFGGRVLLSERTARTFGVVWLVVGILFGLVAFGLWRYLPWSLAALIGAAVISLILSAAWWPLARVGVFVNIALLVGVVGAGYRQFRNDLSQARLAAASQSLISMTDRGLIEYATAGDGDPVLVIHGTGGGWDQALYAADGLSARGFHLIAPSRFGYLRTPMPADHSPAAEADAFASLLDTLGVDRVAVISFSAGTAPALQFAIRHPRRVTALVLMVPAAGGVMPPPAKGPPAFVMDVVLGSDLPMWLALRHAPRTVSSIAAVPYPLLDSLSDADRDRYARGVRMLLPITQRRRGLLNDARNQSGAEPVYPLGDIRVPTLLVSADDDLYHTAAVARHAASRIPESRLLIVPTGGHFLLGRDAEVWPAVADFIRGAEARDASAARPVHALRVVGGATGRRLTAPR